MRATGASIETAVVVHHDPARAILAEMDARRADLVAIATHGRSGMARLRLGSVADKVVRAAPCPVLVARPATGGDA
jgi:nucleotide-binding universal stress UspA family protein